MLQIILLLLLLLFFALCALTGFMAALAGEGFEALIAGIVFSIIVYRIIKKVRKKYLEVMNKKTKSSIKKEKVKRELKQFTKEGDVIAYSNQESSDDKATATPDSKVEIKRAPVTENVICLDTETTGLTEKDEILQLSIVDINGNILFSEYIRPEERKRWPKAQQIHGISYSMVKDKQTLLDHREEIERIINGAALIVGYNIEYDLRMLRQSGIKVNRKISRYDVMHKFSSIYGEPNSYRGGYKWQKLTTCANYYGYKLNAHDALEDAKATIYCYKCIEGIN